ncbi:MAG: hypothetical protein HY305_03525 [Sphingobacteriales bacterium]|nr:hypothetical protein [Sphingobacteriales bacterium]
MKVFLLSIALFLISSISFSQTFMHGAGVSIIVAAPEGSNTSIAPGLTYSPRINFIETESLSVSLGIPLSIGFSGNYSATSSTYGGTKESNTLGLSLQVPLMINLNIGRGATKENKGKVGYFVGTGYGYYQGAYVVTQSDLYGNETKKSISYNTAGPALNAGVRIGVGRAHKNIEIRLGYLKGVSSTKSDIFSLAALFNF